MILAPCIPVTATTRAIHLRDRRRGFVKVVWQQGRGAYAWCPLVRRVYAEGVGWSRQLVAEVRP